MRIILSCIAIVVGSFASLANADLNHVDDGHFADFLWSANTNNAPLKKVGGPIGNVPGSGSYSFGPNSLKNPPATYSPFGRISTSASNDGQTLKLNQSISAAALSIFPSGKNRELDVAQLSHYTFTVSQTEMYKVTFEYSGLFDSLAAHSSFPFGPSYSYTGAAGFFSLYDQSFGPSTALANFGFTGGAGSFDVDPSDYGQPIATSLTEYVLLEAGKTYEMDSLSFLYLGGDGFMAASSSLASSVTISAVPEPGSICLFTCTLACAGLRAYRKRQRQAD